MKRTKKVKSAGLVKFTDNKKSSIYWFSEEIEENNKIKKKYNVVPTNINSHTSSGICLLDYLFPANGCVLQLFAVYRFYIRF